ncbi:hypothetical protein CALVIDRAFT_543049 [Calocera viscosa TUFC12733]|uniref:HNH nuclease domain-containing protein n=1 Tax=Calocera viscosa (strain TUFC12733) TaxID=1330018 RepID=A0A167G0N8_CALVF|nr:hypothetical protein CALVIDRAFT_543049 [Calocera viscosa TUFC12733]
MDLANFYFEQFVLAFRRHAPTPNPSEHPSRPSFDDSVDWFQLLIEEGPRNHQAAKVLALKRDNFRCLLTGCIDSSAILEGHLEWDHQTPLGRTEVCHIIPKGIFSNISGDNEGGPRHRAAAGVAAVLAQFSSPNVPADLSGPGMNALGNLLTLRADLHQEFDRLDFWFEETNAPNTYTIGRIHPGIVSQMTQPITFTTADPSYDLPNADYLRLHAICARIAHLSGAGELIDRVYRDSELVSPLRIVDGELEMMYLKAQLQSIVVRTLVQEVQ